MNDLAVERSFQEEKAVLLVVLGYNVKTKGPTQTQKLHVC